jgi:hypothetical protein
MRNVLLGSLVVFLAATAYSAANQPIERKTGLKVGEKAPAFKLKDQNGKERTLEEFTKQGMVARLPSLGGMVTVLPEATGSVAEGDEEPDRCGRDCRCDQLRRG